MITENLFTRLYGGFFYTKVICVIKPLGLPAF